MSRALASEPDAFVVLTTTQLVFCSHRIYDHDCDRKRKVSKTFIPAVYNLPSSEECSHFTPAGSPCTPELRVTKVLALDQITRMLVAGHVDEWRYASLPWLGMNANDCHLYWTKMREQGEKGYTGLPVAEMARSFGPVPNYLRKVMGAQPSGRAPLMSADP